jgi:hypothetical protein
MAAKEKAGPTVSSYRNTYLKYLSKTMIIIVWPTGVPTFLIK